MRKLGRPVLVYGERAGLTSRGRVTYQNVPRRQLKYGPYEPGLGGSMRRFSGSVLVGRGGVDASLF